MSETIQERKEFLQEEMECGNLTLNGYFIQANWFDELEELENGK